MKFSRLIPETSVLLIVDVQEKLFPLVEHPCEMLDKGLKLIKGCQALNVPIVVSEQYPKGLGSTVEAIKGVVGESTPRLAKTTFSCVSDPALKSFCKSLKRPQWILMGIEAHVCILQSAKGLLEEGYEVVVANDAISSRSIYDFSTAIAEMRDYGIRVTSTETILFELVADSKRPEFKAISELIKT